MTRHSVAMMIVAVLLAGSSFAWGEQEYLYTPQAVVADEKAPKSDGILVREIPIKKGDTLSHISRKFSGHSSYYPQILLFNDIKNPNRIYTGDLLRVPVSRNRDALSSGKKTAKKRHVKLSTTRGAGQRATVDRKKGATAEERQGDVTPKPVAPVVTHARNTQASPEASSATSEQLLFERAIKAYRRDDYRAALELFDRFLLQYPSSLLAADATLYKAECYMKQSNQ